MKKIRYLFEAILLAVPLLIFRLLPLDAASNTGGFIGRTVGPRLAASRKALRNLELAMPELDDDARQKIITGMWENLGRIVAEYPHLEKIGRERTTIVYNGEAENLFQHACPSILISAHMANWEITSVTFLSQLDFKMDFTYRAPNNPWVDRILLRARTLGGKVRAYHKSRQGGQQILKAVRDGRHIGILIDQKYNEGLAVPFFGRDAMTNPVFAKLGLKFDCPVFPVRIERTEGAHFILTIHEPLALDGKDVEDVIAQAHSLLEDWIRARPEQWLWLHRRWGSVETETEKDAA